MTRGVEMPSERASTSERATEVKESLAPFPLALPRKPRDRVRRPVFFFAFWARGFARFGTSDRLSASVYAWWPVGIGELGGQGGGA